MGKLFDMFMGWLLLASVIFILGCALLSCYWGISSAVTGETPDSLLAFLGWLNS